MVSFHAAKHYSLSPSSFMVRLALDTIVTPSSAEEMMRVSFSGSSTVVSLTILRAIQMSMYDDSETVVLSKVGIVAVKV